MTDFIVSARKYRPSKFDDVIGQSSVTLTLKNAITNNQLAQSFLFCGPRGVGKTSCARIFAKEINKFSTDDNIEDFSFNIFELDAASNNSVEDIRNLTDQVRIPPQIGKYKVYIIDEVHMLSAQAFNAFLKTLEEPPSHAKFILATTEKHKIIPTILSRCQIFDFKRLTNFDISEYLSYVSKNEGVQSEKEALNLIADKSDGAMRDALSLYDKLVSSSNKKLSYQHVIKHLNILDYDYYFKITNALLESNITELLNIFNDVLENGFEGQHFILGLSNHLRDLLVSSNNKTIKLFDKGDVLKHMYQEQSDLCEISFLINALNLLNECDIQYKSSNNKRLLVEMCLMRISSFENGFKKKINKSFVIKVDKNKKNNLSLNKDLNKLGQKEIKDVSENKDKITDTNLKSKYDDTMLNKNHKSKMISINNSINNLAEDQDLPKRNLIERNDQEILEIDLVNKWNALIIYLKEQGKVNLEIILNSYAPKLKSESIIEVKLSNSSQLEIFLENKYMILDFLKSKLNNNTIDIETLIVEKEKTDVAYTNKDKFKKMLDKNPNLSILQKKIGLDPDY